MLKKLVISLLVYPFILLLVDFNSCFGNEISVGEAYEIANEHAAQNYNISTEIYSVTIFLNTNYNELWVKSNFVTDEKKELSKKLKNKTYVAIQFMDKRGRGIANDIVTTYYIDLNKGEIIYIERAI